MGCDRPYRPTDADMKQLPPSTMAASRPKRDTTRARQRCQNDLQTFGLGEVVRSVSPEARPSRKRHKIVASLALAPAPPPHVPVTTANASENVVQPPQLSTPESQPLPEHHNSNHANPRTARGIQWENRKRQAIDPPEDEKAKTTAMALPAQQTSMRPQAQLVRLNLSSHGKPIMVGTLYDSKTIKQIGRYAAIIEVSRDDVVPILDDLPFHEGIITYMLEFIISNQRRLPPLDGQSPQEFMAFLQLQELSLQLGVNGLAGALADEIRTCPGMTALKTKTFAMMAHSQQENLTPLYPNFSCSMLEIALKVLLRKHYDKLKGSGLLKELNRQGGRLSDTIFDLTLEQGSTLVKTEPVE